MEGVEIEKGVGWDRLWSAQSERVAEIQRRLQSACRDAALLDGVSHQQSQQSEHSAQSSGQKAVGARTQTAQAQTQDVSAQVRSTESEHTEQPGLRDTRETCKPQTCQAMPADEGAGSYPLESAPCALDSVEVPQAIAYHEEITNVSNEVLRLRLLKSQHEELKAQLSRAEANLRRLSPHAVFQFRSFLEKHFREPGLASHLQEPIVRLLQCLFAVFRMEVSTFTAEAMLSGVRRLFRDPHSFTSKLSSMSFSSEEAKKLAPFLTSGSQFRRVREKEVNECHEALHAWLSSFYTYSSVSDQVAVTIQQLENQEWILRRLNSQDDGHQVQPGTGVGGHLPQAPSASPVLRPSCGGTQGSLKTTNSARVTASPLSRRRALQGIGATSSRQLQSGRARAENEGASRSQSPAQATRNARSRVVPSVAFGSPGSVSGRPSNAASTIVRPGSGTGRQRADTAPALHGEGLGRVHSEKTLTRSPRTAARRDSRSPSPGNGRTSPLAALQRPRIAAQPFRGRKDGPISPSPSEGTIGSMPTAQRMVSAPVELASRSVAVRSTKTPASSARISSNRHSATAPPGRPNLHSASAKTAARYGSPDKGGGAPREQGTEVTPRTCHRNRSDDAAFAAKHCKNEGSLEDSEGEDGDGHIRRLSEKQYEALVRCAQQVVALSGAGGLAPRG